MSDLRLFYVELDEIRKRKAADPAHEPLLSLIESALSEAHDLSWVYNRLLTVPKDKATVKP